MCTAISMKTKDCYFGRTLDLDRSYGEKVVVMPERFPIYFSEMGELKEHYALIGMATVIDGIPLFYEAANEKGLAMAGLNFPENACYSPSCGDKDNVASFEFIPWILGQCKNISEAKTLLGRINITDRAFSEAMPTSPLHWMISDGSEAVVVEARKSGLYIHNNSVGVMTNNPPFEYQLANLDGYKDLRNDNEKVIKAQNPDYTAYSQGLGAQGLPGDVSSASRFVRAAFALKHSVSEEDELSSVGQFFHILSDVSMIKGFCKTDEGTWDITGYTSCINLDKGLYYYTTYTNRQISCVDIHSVDFKGNALSCFELRKEENIFYYNR